MTVTALSSSDIVAPVRSGQTARRLANFAFYLVLGVSAVIWIAPVYLLVSTAFKSSLDFATNGALALPSHIEWGNFAKAWDAGIKTYFTNSLIMTLIKVPIGVVIAAMAAFALSLMNLPRSRLIFGVFLIGLIVPIQMTLVPLTVLLRNLNMIDSLFGLFWIYLGFGLPFGILVLRGFMKAIPRELVEAAFIDGCSWFGVFWRVVLPLSKPAVVSLLIFDGVATWNEFLLAQIFLRADSNRTLPLGVVNFQTEYATAYELLAAAQCITIAPLIIVYLVFQRHFVDGLSGSVKS
jgi:raffinose/stachyose/melibiose transport system permease protein